jgi:hypothetical protein
MHSIVLFVVSSDVRDLGMVASDIYCNNDLKIVFKNKIFTTAVWKKLEAQQ